MNKYTEVVINAINKIKEGRVQNPVEAWELSAVDVLGNKITSYNRICTRNTFLGLCEEGYIKGINKGKYTLSKLNKDYAINIRDIVYKNEVTEVDKLLIAVEINDKKHYLQLELIKDLYQNELLL